MSAVNTEEGKNAADCGCISSSVLNASFKACIWSACSVVSYEGGLDAGTGVDERETLAAKSVRGVRYGWVLRPVGRLYQFRTVPGGGTEAYRASGIGRGVVLTVTVSDTC